MSAVDHRALTFVVSEWLGDESGLTHEVTRAEGFDRLANRPFRSMDVNMTELGKMVARELFDYHMNTDGSPMKAADLTIRMAAGLGNQEPPLTLPNSHTYFQSVLDTVERISHED